MLVYPRSQTFRLQFLIACSMHKRRKKLGLVNLAMFRGTHDVTGSRYKCMLQVNINWRWGRPGTEANRKLEVGKARDRGQS